jgi:hypothetical protein
VAGTVKGRPRRVGGRERLRVCGEARGGGQRRGDSHHGSNLLPHSLNDVKYYFIVLIKALLAYNYKYPLCTSSLYQHNYAIKQFRAVC